MLDDRAIRYRDLGRREDALAAAQQSRAFRCELAEVEPEYQQTLDISFDLLSDAYARLGRFEEAVIVKEEGLKIRRDPWSLIELSTYYKRIGRFDDAVERAEEAVAIDLQRAEVQPRHLTLLMASLDHLSATYREVGRLDEALVLAAEVVAIHRDFADSHPGHHCHRCGQSARQDNHAK